MSKFKLGDRVICYRDTEIEEQQRTGIWHMPSCEPRLIGKKGTVVGFYRDAEIEVHFDTDQDNVDRIVLVDDYKLLED